MEVSEETVRVSDDESACDMNPRPSSLTWENRPGSRADGRVPGLEKPWNPGKALEPCHKPDGFLEFIF